MRTQTGWLIAGPVWVASAVAVASCSFSESRGDSLEIRRDSAAAVADTVYQTRLSKYRRDEVVIDSLTNAARQDPIIRTDSLYHVYRLAVQPNGASAADVQLVACLELSLTLRYGAVPSKRIIQQLRDTVFRDIGRRDGLEYFVSRAPEQGALRTSACGPRPVVLPDPFNGTRLDVDPQPPRPTKAPL